MITFDPGLTARLRQDLLTAQYTVERIGTLMGDVAVAALDREESLPALRALAGCAEPAAVLCRLFMLGERLPERLVAGALPELTVAGARQLGLVDGSLDLRAVVDLRPYAAADSGGDVDWWLASDPGELTTGTALPGDHVLGAGGASVTLAQVTIRDDVGRVLDLGTGCGVQALHASRHARQVVATDISERALAFARFNACLNLVEVELRAGSMLAPVAGEQFDRIVSNPPFVITPRSETGEGDVPFYEYRDGGRRGDDLVRDLIAEVGGVLAPGGIAQFLGNWEHRLGQDWREQVGSWLDASGLDGWVIQREVLDVAQYAETWIRDGGVTSDRDPAAWVDAYGRWLDDFDARGVSAVGFGIVLLRKPADGRVTLRRLEEHTGTVQQPLGPHLGAVLVAHDWLAARSDEQLVTERFVVAGDVTEERFFTPGSGDPNVVLLRQGGGFGRVVHASASLAAFVGACDGELPAGRLIAAIASIFEVDAGALGAELLPAIRGLVRDGLLVVGRG